MKKGKLVLTIMSVIFALVGALIVVACSLFKASGFTVVELVTKVPGLFDFSAFALPGSLPHLISLIVVGLALLVSLIMLIVSLAKKSPKQFGTFFLNLLVAGVALVFGGFLVSKEAFGSALAEDSYFAYLFATAFTSGKFHFAAILIFVALALVALAVLFAIIGDFLYIAANSKAAKEEVPAVEEAPVAEEAAPVIAEEAHDSSAVESLPVEEKPAEEPVANVTVEETALPKVVRRILVNKSGKVVRVLNEHYIDVTTNIYYEPGMIYAEKPTITEAQHYEEIINSQKPAPAPVAKPAPAPAPVKKAEPAPAPAPVVEEKVRAERVPFDVRMKKADKALKDAYNEIKSEILSYGIKSRVSSTGDTFRLHKKTYAKVVIAGKKLKFYIALKPKDYANSTFPVGDASDKNAYQDIPLVFKVKSDLSVRRCKQLIADAAKKDNLVQGEVVKHNWAKDIQ